MSGEQTAVAGEPRLFVGQIPITATAEDLLPLFAPFAARGLRALNIIKEPDGRSKGCAMVLFERWAEAEAAMEAHDGRTRLHGPASRPLVVGFANPKKIRPGEPPEPAIAPRKLFIGQVPKHVTELDLRPLFEPYGEIMCLNVLRTQRGQGPSAGCAFVEYRKWAQAERAMEGHNGSTRLPGADMPLVVKFADAKRSESLAAVGYGMHPSFGAGQPLTPWLAGLPDILRRDYGGPYSGPYNSAAPLGGAYANGYSDTVGSANSSAFGLAGGMSGGSYGRQLAYGALDGLPGSNGLLSGLNSVPGLQYGSGNMGALPVSQNSVQQESSGHQGSSSSAALSGQAAGSSGGHGAVAADGSPGISSAASRAATATTEALLSMGALSISDGISSGVDSGGGHFQDSISQGLPLKSHHHQQLQQQIESKLLAYGTSSSAGGSPGSIAAAAALAVANASIGSGGYSSPGLSLQGLVAHQQQQQQGGNTPGMGISLAHGLPGSQGMAYLNGLAAINGLRLGNRGLQMANGGPAAHGLDEAAAQWKLFVGQVPIEAVEEDLYALFAPLGEILELYVLRNNQTGRSRGCAFVTYVSRHLAEGAISALNGRQVASGKALVVKFADRVPL